MDIKQVLNDYNQFGLKLTTLRKTETRMANRVITPDLNSATKDVFTKAIQEGNKDFKITASTARQNCVRLLGILSAETGDVSIVQKISKQTEKIFSNAKREAIELLKKDQPHRLAEIKKQRIDLIATAKQILKLT